MSESDKTNVITKEALEALSSIERQSDLHHKELADKFLGLSLSVAFLLPAFLISLETLLPPTTSESPLAIQISWCAACLSAIFGALHLWLEMLLPRHAYNMAVEATRDLHLLGVAGVHERAARKTHRFLLGFLLHHAHVILLFVAIVSIAWYRAANFQ